MSDKEFKVLITETAAQDLRGICEYIAYELLSPDTAEGQFARLENAVMSLKDFPNVLQDTDASLGKHLGFALCLLTVT